MSLPSLHSAYLRLLYDTKDHVVPWNKPGLACPPPAAHNFFPVAFTMSSSDTPIWSRNDIALGKAFVAPSPFDNSHQRRLGAKRLWCSSPWTPSEKKWALVRMAAAVAWRNGEKKIQSKWVEANRKRAYASTYNKQTNQNVRLASALVHFGDIAILRYQRQLTILPNK